MRAEVAEIARREAQRRGITRSQLIEAAVRREAEAPEIGVVVLEPSLHARLEDAAARMGHSSSLLLGALIRDHLPALDAADVDPDLKARRAARRARELLR